jgi:exonuclease 3'-5' domain-containing protein 1
MSAPTSIVLVDDLAKLRACIDDMPSSSPASVAIDLEGVFLGRRGRIAIMQLYVECSDTIWLVDVTTLGAEAFQEVDAGGSSLSIVLENPNIRKV